MTQYNTINVKLSNSQLNKSKSRINNDTALTLNLSSNVVGDSNDETNFPCNLLFTNPQVSRLHKGFTNGLPTNIKLTKIQLSRIGQSEWLLDRFVGQLLKTGLHLMKSALKPLAKSVSIPLGLTAAASATDAAIQKKIFEQGVDNLKWKINGIMKIIKYLGDAGSLIKGASRTNENEANEQKSRFFSMLLGALGAT